MYRTRKCETKKNLPHKTAGEAKTKAYEKNLFLFQIFLHIVGGDNLFFEAVGTGLFGADHADNLGETLAGLGLKGSNNFLCHILLSPILSLLDFFVNSDLLQEGIVLLELQTLRGVLFILGGDVAAHAGDTASLLLSAFEDDLHSVSFYFLCHNCVYLLNCLSYDCNLVPVAIAIGDGFLEGGIEALPVNDAQAGGAQAQLNPAAFLYVIEFLLEQVHIERALCATLGV